MGCLSSKEKYRVYEKENERKIKSYRVPGKSVNGYSSSNLSGSHLNRDLSVTSLAKEREEEGENSRQSDKPLDCDMSTIITTPPVKVEPFSSRNQFDRASQLRRSRKKRRKSDAGNNTITSEASVVSPSREDSRVSRVSLSHQEKMFSSSRAEYSSNYGNLI